MRFFCYKELNIATKPVVSVSFIHFYIYIYIYIYIYKKENKTGHIRIINLFPSCYVFLIKSKNTKKKINRTSSDLMDEIIQNRHRKEGWEGIEDG